jgi:hypothetical protein
MLFRHRIGYSLKAAGIALQFLLCTPDSQAQEKRGVMGIGLSAGGTNYIGELDDNFTLVFTRLGAGAHVNFLFFSRVHIRLAAFHGRVTADDARGTFSGNGTRNLNFFSDIDEAGIHVLYILQSRNKGFSKRNRIAPYVFAGLGYFRFDPETTRNGVTYRLQKVGTEGQYLSSGNYPEPYKLQQFCIPMGIGFQLKITQNFDFGVETGFRRLFTDYLDDVSGRYPDKAQLLQEQGPVALYLSDPSNDPDQPNGKPSFARRGNPNSMDWYVYTNVHLTYYFTTALFGSYKLKNQFRDGSCKGLLRK